MHNLLLDVILLAFINLANSGVITEYVPRAALELALGVPLKTTMRQIYAGTQVVPISAASEDRAIGKLMKLHFTN